MSAINSFSDSSEDLELEARKTDIDKQMADWPKDPDSIYPQITLSDLEHTAAKLSATLDSLSAQIERK